MRLQCRIPHCVPTHSVPKKFAYTLTLLLFASVTAFSQVSFDNVTTVSAASFADGSQAPGSIVAAFGTNFSDSADLNSVMLRLKSVAGIEFPVSHIFFVSPSQINFQLP